MPALDWVIVGGESGHKARPMHPDWARSLRDQCERFEVPLMFKQWGQWTATPANRDLREPHAWVNAATGEVADEHDKVTPGVLQTAAGRWYFPAELRPDEAQAQITSLSVPEDGAYETIGGFIMARLGRLAAVGDVVSVDGGTLSVERMDGRRVERVRFDPAAAADKEARA